MDFRNFVRQTAALTKKNLVIAVVRHPISTLVRALFLPVAFLVLILKIKIFLADTNHYGVGSPAPVQSLNGRLLGVKDLVFVSPPSAGSDIDRVLQQINSSLEDVASQLVYYNDEVDLLTHCLVNIHGVSNCYAAVVFNDSPLTSDGIWRYTIRADPQANGLPVDVFSQNNIDNTFWLPLQLAIENAITNSTVIPDAYMFTTSTEADQNLSGDQHFLDLVIRTYAIALFIATLSVIYHVVGMITAERESGMSQLVDIMGGNSATAARVLSYVLAFDLIYMPCWFISGFLYWHLLIPSSNAAVLIFWYILTGWSITSASVFAAGFFRKYQLSGVYCVVGFLVVALGGLIMDGNMQPPGTGPVTALSLIFPSMNFMFALAIYCRFQELDLPVDMLHVPPSTFGRPVPSSVSAIELWFFLVIQIIIYTTLAVVLEKVRHGVNFRHRTFKTGLDASEQAVALQTFELGKVYPLSLFQRLFSYKNTSEVVALDGLNLVSQRCQILCLLGANGSGKTTTLDLICGVQRPTAGSVQVNASATQLGLCPQRNVLYDELTVYEHVQLWGQIKGGHEDLTAITNIIDACDLSTKTTARADSLSGGQRRKLQLACTFVGESSLCLMDEVTTGLDPLSRRHIWNIILAERSKRSIVLTTHYLDECEVLADQIAILSRGKLKCQGPTATLLNEHGGGYRVHVPWRGDTEKFPGLKSTFHQDRVVYTVSDSASAARLISTLSERGETDVSLTGPTVEDVFLAVSDEYLSPTDDEGGPEIFQAGEHSPELKTVAADHGQQLSHAEPASFASQILVLFKKRLFILRRNWWPYFFAVGVPVAVTPVLNKFLYLYVSPSCADVLADVYRTNPFKLQSSFMTIGSQMSQPSSHVAVGPLSANYTIYNVLNSFEVGMGYDMSHYASQFLFKNTLEDLENFVSASFANVTPGALWMGGNGTNPTFAYNAQNGMFPGLVMQNIWSQARSGVQIAGAYEFLASRISPQAGNSLGYAAYFCLIQLVYPALFCIYPAYERLQRVRALQYSNGLRPLPLWLAYTLFDSCFILAISFALTITTWQQFPYWYNVGYFFPVLFLHGLAATLMGYVISTVASSQLAAFGTTAATSAIMFVLSILTFSLEEAFADPSSLEWTMKATNFSLNLIFPIGNVFRAITIGLNIYVVTCQGNQLISYPGSIYAYGGPIFYLCIQICFFWFLLQWLDRGSFPSLTRNYVMGDIEKSPSVSSEVEQETHRVEGTESDLLRILHVSKSFGTNKAISDVSVGIGEGEILALLGTNGAGKTTIVNTIRGDLKPSEGTIFVRGIGVQSHTRETQKYLGVCPQFDALDLLTAREHLEFYAQAKGIENVELDVAMVMAKVGLTPYADRMPAKMSGGNKRKLSLAIALIGNPDILLLDEPSSSMDVVAKRIMWRTLTDIAPGRSILLTTHSMEEADALATRVAILSKRLLAIGSTQSLRQKYSNEYHVRLILKTAPVSSISEVLEVEAFVTKEFAHAKFDGQSLGGQIKFTVPASPRNSSTACGIFEDEIRAYDPQEPRGVQNRGASLVVELIEKLERHKEELGLEHYSVGAITLERVFMNVARQNNVGEEEPTRCRWRFWL